MTNIFQDDLDKVFTDNGWGVECSHCKERKIVREGDRLCVDCWELLGEPENKGGY